LAISGYGAVLPIRHPVYYGAWFTAWLVTYLGISFFQNWARHTYLALTIFGLLLIPFSGYVVALPLDYLLGSIVTVFDGVILGMAYSSPFSNTFKKCKGRVP
jgi:hypothetical protein